MEQTFMKEKNILQLVLSMSLPMVISMAVNSLYNIIDSCFVVKVSENAMTALALVYPIQNLINAIAIGFGVGMNAIIAFYLGSDDQVQADKAATQGTFLSFMHGMLLSLVCILGAPVFLKNFSSDVEIIELCYGMLLSLYRQHIYSAGLSVQRVYGMHSVLRNLFRQDLPLSSIER